MRNTVPALGPGPASRRAGRQAVEGQQDNLEADSAHCLVVPCPNVGGSAGLASLGRPTPAPLKH